MGKSRKPSGKQPSQSRVPKIDPTGTYSADCAAGAFAARAFLKEMLAEHAYERLGFRIHDMIKAGTFGGYEVGFSGEIARAVGGVTRLSTVYEVEALVEAKYPVREQGATP